MHLQQLDTAQLQRFFSELSERYRARREELCELDRGIGDGDHGLTVSDGFRRAVEALCDQKPQSVAAVFHCAAESLMGMPGAIGPIFATFFLEAADAIGDKPLNLENMARAFEAGVAGIRRFSGTSEGDKTLIDALAPASRALQDAAARGLSLVEGLTEAARSAADGAEATRHMRARRGRARFAADGGVGAIDPGAVSAVILLETLRDVAMEAEQHGEMD